MAAASYLLDTAILLHWTLLDRRERVRKERLVQAAAMVLA